MQRPVDRFKHGLNRISVLVGGFVETFDPFEIVVAAGRTDHIEPVAGVVRRRLGSAGPARIDVDGSGIPVDRLDDHHLAVRAELELVSDRQAEQRFGCNLQPGRRGRIPVGADGAAARRPASRIDLVYLLSKSLRQLPHRLVERRFIRSEVHRFRGGHHDRIALGNGVGKLTEITEFDRHCFLPG